MKSKLSCMIIFIMGFINIPSIGQKIYPVTSGEMIFSQGKASFTDEFLSQYPDAKLVANNVRYTIFLHIGQYFHCDFTNNFGLFTGLAIRNVGMITDETLPQTVSTTVTIVPVPYVNYIICRRQYMLGVPLAIKLGS